LFRLARPGAAAEALGKTSGFISIICAGGRKRPCVLAEWSGRDVVLVDWDPDTGARGSERARWVMTSYATIGALAPDGHTLAQVLRFHERRDLFLLDLRTGVRRRIAAAGTSLDFPSWEPDGKLLAMGSKGAERGIWRV